MPEFYLSLGSNVGDREKNLAVAVALLKAEGLAVRRVSSVYETEPVGQAAGPGWFLNMAVGGETDLFAEGLLDLCLRVEREMGRERPFRGAPRKIDIDVLLVGQEIVETPGCEVPHPRMHGRRFVLRPLAEIAGSAVHPRLGRTAGELLAALDDPAVVRRRGPAGVAFGSMLRQGDKPVALKGTPS